MLESMHLSEGLVFWKNNLWIICVICNIYLAKKMSGKPSDDQLRQAIDAIFNKYDTDKSGTLEENEIFNLINDAFKSLGRNREVSQQEVKQFISAIDKNGDGKIAKPELFEILKQLINSGWTMIAFKISINQ